ncbi:helix-turn-helix transcriptional regulator [Patescibacteria group bacterium]|nr:helix-turn-helix transcriptional regulator [Patescibacteria group bacterium]
MPRKIQKELPPIELLDEKTVSERIIEARKLKGLSQNELADKIGITRELFASYELGRSRIYDEMLTRIAIALDVTPNRLLGFEKDENTKENISLRYTKRIKEIEKLPEHKKKVILKTIDDSIKANKE